jgi:hypothetical protein
MNQIFLTNTRAIHTRLLYVCVASSLFFFVACNTNGYSKDEYIKHIRNENAGLKKTIKNGNLIYLLQYKPIEYMALQETQGVKKSASEFQQIKDTYQGMEYYTLSIRVEGSNKDPLMTGIKTPNEYFDRSSYCAFDMQRDLKMVIKSYNTNPFCNFSIGFEIKPNTRGERHLVFNDKIFAQQESVLTISDQAIINSPKLLLN